jgi:hypothetical protein
LEEESSSTEEEDRSLNKRRDTEDDDGNGEEIKLHDSSRIKDSTKISIPSEETSIVYKCEGGFYSASQILADKDNNMDYI